MTSRSMDKEIDDWFKCSICLFHFLEPVALSCQHIFCKDCILAVKHDTCPICRIAFFRKQIIQENIVIRDSMLKLLGKDLIRNELLEKKKMDEEAQKYKERKKNLSIIGAIRTRCYWTCQWIVKWFLRVIVFYYITIFISRVLHTITFQ
jgi:Zinc finger, C3HC4 type (RING finger)